MATYFTGDFSGFSIGSTWTRRWDTPDTDWNVSSGELLADNDSTNTNFCGVSWDTTGDDDDVDILVKFQGGNVVNRYYPIFVRGSGSAGSPKCYAVAVTSTSLRIYYFNSSETGTSLGSTTISIINNTYYFLRLRVNSDDLTATIWATTGSESSPIGTLTITNDTSISGSGWLGLLYYQPNGSSTKYDQYGVGTNGDTAPSSGTTTRTGTGALTSAAASIAGTGRAFTTITGTGALASQAAAVSGAGTAYSVITGTGALAAGSGSLAGAGKRVVTGFADLIAGSASISGAGDRIIVATAALAAQAATISGTGVRAVVGMGALAAQSSDITGSGSLEGVVAGSGQLAAGSATIAGTGEVTGAKTGTGALAAGPATIAGTGTVITLITGTGALAAGTASVAGTGTVVAPTVITGTGAIQAGQATINGIGIREVRGTGSLVAGNATISGRELAVAGWLCGTPSIYAALSATPDIDPSLTATFTTYPEGCA